MYEIIFLLVLAIIWIIFATIQDLKTREIANWLNFSLIIFALGFRLFYSLFFQSGFEFFYQGLIGFAIFFVLGNILYYGRLFAGGDAKLLIALGAILPFSLDFNANLKIFALFLFIFLIVGAIYSLSVSFVLCLKNLKNFKKEFLDLLKKNKRKLYLPMSLGLILMVFGFFEFSSLFFGIFIFILPYLYFYSKAVEEVCMVKKIKTSNLQEGDWLYKDLKVGAKVLKVNWDGLTKKEINLLKKNKKYILIKQGIPFSPTFFVTFLVFIYLWKIGLWNSFW